MTMKRTPRPRDPVQLGKLMVDIMTGQVPDAAGAAAMGRKGAAARAAGMTPELDFPQFLTDGKLSRAPRRCLRTR